jgi:hypothetical protein
MNIALWGMIVVLILWNLSFEYRFKVIFALIKAGTAILGAFNTTVKTGQSSGVSEAEREVE